MNVEKNVNDSPAGRREQVSNKLTNSSEQKVENLFKDFLILSQNPSPPKWQTELRVNHKTNKPVR
jgi:hypothetical protein